MGLSAKKIFAVAIDPMALLLPPEVYAKWVEGHHPHVPKVAELEKIFEKMTPAEVKTVFENARTLVAYGKAVEEGASKFMQ